MAVDTKIHNFEDSLKNGEEGEEIIIKFLKQMPGIRKVVNMAGNHLFYKKDVDFVIELDSGEKRMLELKTDSYTSGNIYYETVSNEKYNVGGCMEKTACHWLLYYFINFDKCYFLRFDKYRELMEKLIKENHPALKEHKVTNWAKDGINTYDSVGYTLPLCVLEELMNRNDMRIEKDIKKRLDI